MTSANTLTNRKKYSGGKFYGFRLRSTWHILLIFVLVTLVVMVVPSVLSAVVTRLEIVNLMKTMSAEMIAEGYSQTAALGIGNWIISIALAAVFAFIAGMNCLSFLNNKKGVDCFHSFPLKRETLFFTDTTIFAIYYLISNVIGFALTYAAYSIIVPVISPSLKDFVIFMAASVIMFLVIYTTVIFAGTITGTGFTKIILALILLVLGFALAGLLILCFWSGAMEIDLEYYLVEKGFLFNASPAIRLIKDLVLHYIAGQSAFKLLWALPEVVVLYVASLFLYKIRKSERTGTSIVWKPVAQITKYLLMFIAAMAGCLSFSVQRFVFGLTLIEDNIWTGTLSLIFMIAGALINSFIAYIILNAILFRSGKKMFADFFPGFVAFCAAVIVFIILVPFNSTGLIGKPYSAANTKGIEIKINGYTLEVDDTDYFVDCLREQAEEKADPLYEAGLSYGVLDYSTTYAVDIIQKPKVGIPLAKSMSVSTDGVAAKLTKLPQYAENLNAFREISTPDQLRNVSFNLLDDYLWWGNDDADQAETLFESLEYKLDSRENYPIVDQAYVFFINGSTIGEIITNSNYMPVYADNTALLNAMYSSWDGDGTEKIEFNSPEDVYRLVADKSKSFELINLDTKERVSLESSDYIDLAPYTTNISELYNATRSYVDISEEVRYAIVASYEEEYYDYSSVEDDLLVDKYDVEIEPDYREDYYLIYFRDGAITNAEVEAIFNAAK